jgi:hypothetical protein
VIARDWCEKREIITNKYTLDVAAWHLILPDPILSACSDPQSLILPYEAGSL